jgi:Prp8 binding protein
MSLVVQKPQQQQALVPSSGPRKVKRTSSLVAPIVLLSGHENPVLSCKFAPSGDLLVSGDSKGRIFLWNVQNNTNLALLEQHKGPITRLQWSKDSTSFFSASHDCRLLMWDVETRERTRKFEAHTSIINDCAISPSSNQLLASVCDAGDLFVWSKHEKAPIMSINHQYPLTSVTWSLDGNSVFIGSLLLFLFQS